MRNYYLAIGLLTVFVFVGTAQASDEHDHAPKKNLKLNHLSMRNTGLMKKKRVKIMKTNTSILKKSRKVMAMVMSMAKRRTLRSAQAKEF